MAQSRQFAKNGQLDLSVATTTFSSVYLPVSRELGLYSNNQCHQTKLIQLVCLVASDVSCDVFLVGLEDPSQLPSAMFVESPGWFSYPPG